MLTFETSSHLHMSAIAGAAGLVAYSASMNSYTSLTGAPPRSTPRLLKGTRSLPGARGSPAQVPVAAPARKSATGLVTGVLLPVRPDPVTQRRLVNPELAGNFRD